jgi:hypothetical protein
MLPEYDTVSDRVAYESCNHTLQCVTLEPETYLVAYIDIEVTHMFENKSSTELKSYCVQ